MKLGPIEVKLSRQPKQAQPVVLADSEKPPAKLQNIRRGELGATGTEFFAGILSEEDYNTDLMSPQRYTAYDKMRKGDGQVRAGLSAVKLPLLRAEWKIEPGSDSARDKEIAGFIHHNLMEGMSFPWRATFRQILLMLDYGSMPFETVWDIRDGTDGGGPKVHLKKLAARLPKSIKDWHVDGDGGFDGITQTAYRDGAIKDIRIPGQKMLVFVNEQEGSDFKGQSLLRAAYKHWYYKDNLYKVDAISKEKRGIGVDVMTLHGAVDEERRADAERALMTLHAHEKMFMTEIEGEFIYRIAGVEGALADALSSIEHHDLRILRSILAEFLAMGATQQQGSQAMHKDKTSFFIMALGAVASEIVDTFNTYLLRKWVDYNWPGVKKYPHLTHSRLETRDTQALAGAIARLVNVGAITPDEDVEQTLREGLELPSLKPGQLRPQPLSPGTPSGPPKAAADRNGRSPARAKALAIQEVQEEQAERLVLVAEDIISKEQRHRIPDVNVPYKSRLREVAGVELAEELIGNMKESFSARMQLGGGVTMDQLVLALDEIQERLGA